MKQTVKCLNYFWFVLTLCATLISGCSCSAPKPPPDPLAGWKVVPVDKPAEAIVKDYQDYIKKLPAKDNNDVLALFSIMRMEQASTLLVWKSL